MTFGSAWYTGGSGGFVQLSCFILLLLEENDPTRLSTGGIAVGPDHPGLGRGRFEATTLAWREDETLCDCRRREEEDGDGATTRCVRCGPQDRR